MIVAIVNPAAGAGRDRVAWRALLARLSDRGRPVSVRATRGPGDGRRIAGEVPDDAEAVIVVGGDGTVREVAEGLLGRPVPMIIWPTGTENLVARQYGYRATPDVALDCLWAGRTVEMDVGVSDGRAFLILVGVGFDGEVIERLTIARAGHITHLSYLAPILRSFCEHRWPMLRIEADGQAMWEGRGMAFVGNLRQYALGLPVVRDAVGDDGELDLVIMPCSNKWQLLKHSFWTVLGRNVEHGALTRRVQRVRIESNEPVPVEVDGEMWHPLPIDVTIRPKALRLKVPSASARVARSCKAGPWVCAP